jgi:uncharacterized protein (TIGR00645 family)
MSLPTWVSRSGRLNKSMAIFCFYVDDPHGRSGNLHIDMPSKFEHLLTTALYGSRWVMAPFYLGLVAVLAVIVVAFFRELIHAAPGLGGVGNAEVILAVLKLIDLLLVGNLVLIMIFAGAKTLIGRAAEAERPEWMGNVDFGDLRFRFVVSIVAIAAVQVLETSMNVSAADELNVIWQILILLAFVVSGVALAWMDRLTAGRR